jgi:prepilin-type N-terminal cleavage/methylation domain-containing protein
MKFFKRRPRQRGFTLIEMLVVSPIVILAIGAFLTVIISMTGEVIASRASNSLAYNVQDALNRIEQDIKLSSGFLAQNNVLGQDQGYNNDATNFTNIAGASGTSLILNMVATTANPVSINNGYVFLRDKPNDCATPQGNIPFTYNVVYFIKNDTLFRRTIMPANYNDTVNTVCSVPWQQPSCAPSYMDAPSSTFCKTRDIQLVTGVKPGDFSLQYYNGEAAASANAPASSAPVVADRSTALQSATTAGVTINAEQSAGGRTVERSAILRASRLDSNASAIAVLSADTAPPAPQVSSTTGEPTSVTFSWGKLATAASYTFEYQINGGSWITGFSNQPTRTFTVTTATHKDVVNARVTATNSIGTSGYGTSSVTIPLWTPFNLLNGWINYSPQFSTAGYTKTSSGLVVLKGMIRAGSGNIATLPPGYRPSAYIMFENSTNSAGGRVDIQSDGTVRLSVGSNAWYSLDGISFMPSGTSFTAPGFSGGWLNYSPGSGDPNWQNAGYMLDSLGRVQLTGLIRSGTTTSPTAMFNLPTSFRPPEYLHILNNNAGSAWHFGIDNLGNVLAKGGSNTYSSLQAMFYPTGRTTGTSCTTQWCGLPFQNGWKHYGAPYAVPQYTKSADGVVMLKGLLNGGTSATAVIATLPANFCPAEQLLFATISNGLWARLDIARNPNGSCTIYPGTGASTSWFSLDSIRFIAEP